MEFRSDSLDFSQPLRGGPRTASKTILFPRPVVSAVAGMTSYLAEYSGEDDHHLGMLDVRLATETSGNAVTVTGNFGLRDWSGTWDDNYDGLIGFVVLAELEPVTAPPARRDLIITGVEFNQATQFFRANRYLDPADTLPDNSIFLVEGRNTGVRLYVDYDAASGLPVISSLSGELIVSNGAGSTTLAPINPGIVPQRDAAINQALNNATLNFMIPAGLSAGTLTVRARVFDSANPSSASQALTRTLVFTPVQPLNVFLVGVQTQQPAAAAPTQAAVASAFSLLLSTYPRGVQFTGFNTTTLAPAIVGLMPSSGCGDGWSTLNDQLRDLRGGSGDVYFGGLPAGIFSSGVVGCSPRGDRVAASFIDIPATVPHEVGHSLGLRHDACRGCSPPAQDPNEDYPVYSPFGADSIGTFGFDPTTNTVFDPSTATDFMTAFVPGTAWISPYTHQLLLAPTQGGPTGAGSQILLGGEHMTLFLGLEVSRERKVTRRVSFHHPAAPQGTALTRAPFEYEFLDKERKVLDCGHLHCLCESEGCSCWPKTTRDALPFPQGAAFLAVYEEDKAIYEEAIPDPPRVQIGRQNFVKEGVRLTWSSPDAKTFLLHYRDARAQAWRGLTPRLEVTSVVVPWRAFGPARTLKVRVLGSSGIATGFAEVEIQSREVTPPEVSLTLVGLGSTAKGPAEITAVPFVLATDAAGRQLPDAHLAWYDSAGASLGRGRQVDLRQLPDGRSVVRVVAHGHGGRTLSGSWAVERRNGRFLVHAIICDPPRQRKDGPEHKHPHPPAPRCEE